MSEAESKQRLLDALPHLRLAMEVAKVAEPEGKVLLAIIAKKEDGSGTVACSFEGEQFLTDIAALCGVADKPGWMNDFDEEVLGTDEEKPS
jgi:hypothetical protein